MQVQHTDGGIVLILVPSDNGLCSSWIAICIAVLTVDFVVELQRVLERWNNTPYIIRGKPDSKEKQTYESWR